MDDFEAKVCKSGSWMAESLCPGKEVSQAENKWGISMNYFTVEAHIWLNIICNRISPCNHLTTFIDMRACIVSYILDNVSLNVSRLVISNIKFLRNHGGTYLLSLSYTGDPGLQSTQIILGCALEPLFILSKFEVRVHQARDKRGRSTWAS